MTQCKLYECGDGGSQEREVADGADVVFTDTGTHPSHRTRAELSHGSHVPSVTSACPVEVRSCHLVNGFRLSRLSSLF